MRYYVEINGESSLDIQGLMIQSLPSISKPLIRSKQETIDGRDGDIITKLGYGAYDKTLKIGLWGNYDINEVIAFFNQEGTITFSNEPDKYYRFTILNREDYVSQLDKFRTATIMIHCQPFKYKLNEEAEEIENEYTTQEGTSLTFNNSLVAPMNIDLKGNTSQTGTPTPSSPIPINNVSGDNDIVVCGKNVININGIFSYSSTSNLEKSYENGIATLTWYSGFNLYMTQNNSENNFISLPDSTKTYTISFKHKGDALYLRFDESNTNILSTSVDSNYTTYSYTFTNLSEIKIKFVRKDNTGTAYLKEFQIEENSTASPYEAYTGATYPINLGSIELCKIGDYKDYFYKQDDKWYLHKEIGKATFNGTENWATSGAAVPSGVSAYSNNTNSGFITNTQGYSNLFTIIDNATDWNVPSGNGTARYTSNQLYIKILTSIAGDVNALKTWLGNNNITMCGILSTPTNTEITYTPLIEQLNTLEQAQSKEGTTNVNQVNNDAPFIITASVLSGTDSITLTNEGNTTSKPTLTITGSGVVGVYLENIQMFNISLGTNETIIIDTENMEAYYGSQLKNRQVTGDYSNFALQSGTNNLKFTGLVTNVEITNYNRWI